MSVDAAADTPHLRVRSLGDASLEAAVVPARAARDWSLPKIAALALGPVAVAALLVAFDVAWPAVTSASDAATAKLYAASALVRTNPGEVAEAARILLAGALAAIAPSFGIGAFEAAWPSRVLAAIVFYPAWLVVMLIPAGFVRHFSYVLDATLLGTHLSANFLILFSASATSIALLYSYWSHAQPHDAPPTAIDVA